MFALIFAALMGCTSSESSSSESKVLKPIYTLSFPADFLVAQLVRDDLEHKCILPIGEDPPFWKPEPEIVVEVQQASLIVGNGAGFEGWVKTASLPSSKMLQSADGLDLIHMEGQTHSHGKGGDHSHGEIDPHTWSAPDLYAQQAEVVYERLAKLDVEHALQFQERLSELKNHLEQLSQNYAQVLEAFKEVHFAANHPSFSYLFRAYDLKVHNFVFDPEERTSPEQLEKFQQWSESKAPIVLLWESEPTENVRTQFSSSVIHVTLDPLEQPQNGLPYDYFAQAQSNIQKFQNLAVILATVQPEN